MNFWYFPLVTIILITIINISPVCIKINYLRENKDDFLTLQLSSVWGLINFKYEVPVLEKKKGGYRVESRLKFKKSLLREKNTEKNTGVSINYFLEQITQALNKIKTMRKNSKIISIIAGFLKKRVRCKTFYWTTSFGLKDAAETGVISGTMWSVKGTTAAMVQRFFIFAKGCSPEMRVSPDFNKLHFKSELKGDFCLRVYQVYFIAIIVLYLKLQRGVVKKWKTIQSRV